MSELENIKSLEKYDAWKKAKRNRKGNISLIAGLIGGVIALLLTWAILRVSIGDIWNLGKGAIKNSEDIIPKIEEVDNKLKKSIVASPMNWISKKYEEQVAKEISRGSFKLALEGVRNYCLILMGVWLVVWIIIYLVSYYLIYWIIGKYFWHEPTLSEQEIDF